MEKLVKKDWRKFTFEVGQRFGVGEGSFHVKQIDKDTVQFEGKKRIDSPGNFAFWLPYHLAVQLVRIEPLEKRAESERKSKEYYIREAKQFEELTKAGNKANESLLAKIPILSNTIQQNQNTIDALEKAIESKNLTLSDLNSTINELESKIREKNRIIEGHHASQRSLQAELMEMEDKSLMNKIWIGFFLAASIIELGIIGWINLF